MISKELITSAYRRLQNEICKGLEETDGKGRFEEQVWERDGGGGGQTRVLQNGNVLEKAGVNFSAVYGKLPPQIKKALGVAEDDFFATGLSIVVHPNHPWIPIIHMNIRYFEMAGNRDEDQICWFGGGIDLTPHYVMDEDAHFFHQQLKKVCDQFNPAFYAKFKTWADDYFYIKHRQETRGIGGIFYDRLKPGQADISWDEIFSFSEAVGSVFLPVYTELIDRNRHKPFTDEHKQWQYQRRSRYAEFNLVYDAGTKFGLETNGRIESVFMSLPPQANWVYDFKPVPGSEEEKTLNLLRKGINWV